MCTMLKETMDSRVLSAKFVTLFDWLSLMVHCMTVKKPRKKSSLMLSEIEWFWLKV